MNKIDRRTFIKSLLAIVAAGGLAIAVADPPHGKKKKNKGRSGKSAQTGAGALFTAGITAVGARELFRRTGYMSGGYKPLPPGIRKNLARGKPIPPGIAKTRLPASFTGKLPRYPGYEWLGAGVDLLLIQTASGLIADVLFDVLI